MTFTYNDLKQIHDGLITLFAKKDSDIEEFTAPLDINNDNIIVLQNNINKKATIKDIIDSADFATVASTGSYTDLTNKPNLSTVATSGSYNDLSNKPSIPDAQVNSDWRESSSSSKAFILNKPNLDIYDISYIPCPTQQEAQDMTAFLNNHSKIKSTDIISKNILHTVVLEPTTTTGSSSYDITDYVTYYLRILNGRLHPSIIRIEFVAYNSYFTNSDSAYENTILFGKLADIGADTIKVTTFENVKTRCRLELMKVRDANDLSNNLVLITCESLGAII